MKRKLPYYLEVAARVYVFGALSVYGWAKLFGFQFYRHGHLPEQVKLKTLEKLSGFDLAWAFFGYSYPYILFIGVSQVLGATLLLFNRTKFLGAFILIPIMLNIIIVDICFRIPSGAMLNACFFLLMIVLMLFLNSERLIEAFKVLTGAGRGPRPVLGDIVKIAGLSIAILVAGIAFIQVFSYLITLLQ